MSRYYPLFWDWKQRRALFYRIYINIFSIFLGIKLLPLKISEEGFDFYYKGDTIIWLWPKKRINQWGFQNPKWLSILSEGNFHTLKEMDRFWDEYYKHEEERYGQENS